MARKLKVFRTATGFHDAYVAAPSRKAALAAWGTNVDLFARGAAEEVTDPALTAAALARPGEVVRRPRGTAAEYFAALPKTKPRADKPVAVPKSAPRAARPKPKPKPPSRAALSQAETALEKARAGYEREEADLTRRELAIAKERRDFETRRTARLDRMAEAVDAARRAYNHALTAYDRSLA